MGDAPIPYVAQCGPRQECSLQVMPGASTASHPNRPACLLPCLLPSVPGGTASAVLHCSGTAHHPLVPLLTGSRI